MLECDALFVLVQVKAVDLQVRNLRLNRQQDYLLSK